MTENMTENMKKSRPALKIVSKLRFLILDVDGVMTDGSITYTSSGEEMKTFNVKDGSGLKYWNRAGYAAGIITGRSSAIVERRASELDICHVAMGVKAKFPVFEQMIAAAGVSPEETVMIGDDLMDLPIIRRVGLGVAVADAVEEVRDAADMVTKSRGGRGAIREVIEFILKNQGRWDGILERYLL